MLVPVMRARGSGYPLSLYYNLLVKSYNDPEISFDISTN